ncbi:MAG: PQQ-dependent catabolism-associated CXXCW motif protein [Hyphomicrobiaceae bacterium]|nr:PQQ-dependent catabolism-associated CXXCW motif protein [Hyphomicrobiaceae bacterium]
MRNVRAAFVIAALLPFCTSAGLHAEHVDVGPAPPQNAEKPPEPDGYRMDEYRKPVPATLNGATVLTSDKAGELWTKKEAIFVDVYPRAPKPPNLPKGTFWREPIHQTIENATWLANVGYGVISPQIDGYFKSNLEKLTAGDKSKAIVFYCLRDCWMSWNAAKRALTYGYTKVMWYPDGTDGWQEAGLPVVQVTPVPQEPQP